MKMATVRELRNRYTTVLKWIEAGEEVAISRRGKIIARLIPEKQSDADRVDWEESAAVRRDRTRERRLTPAEVETLLSENKGNW